MVKYRYSNSLLGGVIMGYITGQNRGQITIFRETTKPISSKEGRPAYNPKDLLKLYIYGYFNKIRFSRKLIVECHSNPYSLLFPLKTYQIYLYFLKNISVEVIFEKHKY